MAGRASRTAASSSPPTPRRRSATPTSMRIDLAILDWNLGAGNDGLRLLEDLSVFQPDIVAILVTGYAHQATPLDAMRMGVRDYLDKNQDLNRDTFLAAVRKQLDRIRPAKRHRELHRQLVAFRSAVEKVLPLVQSAAALNDPVPLPRAVAGLLRFLCRITGAKDGVLIIRHAEANGTEETYRAYDADGNPMDVELVPFARSVAATALSFGEPRAMNDLAAANGRATAVRARPASLLAAPLAVGSGVQAVLELFDRPGGFRDEDGRWPRPRPRSGRNCSGKHWPSGPPGGPSSTPSRRPGRHPETDGGRRAARDRSGRGPAGRGPGPAASRPGIGPVVDRRRRGGPTAGRGGARTGRSSR